MNPLIYIILVNYKSYKDTIECIESLRSVNYDNFKVVIIENGSNDESYEIIKKKCRDEIIIKSENNLGFAGGNNLGIEIAMRDGAEYILLLNNDTTVEPDFLTHLKEAFNYGKNVGIVGCKINYYKNKNIINYGGGEIVWNKFTTVFFDTDKVDTNDDLIKEITFISGCAMMISRSAIEKIGMLDDSYFMYYEDTDYCARATQSGFKLLYQPKSKIYHKISSSSGGDLSPFVLYWSTKNRQKFRKKFAKNVSILNRIYFDIFNLISRITRVIIYLLKGEKEKSKSILKGYLDGFKEENK